MAHARRRHRDASERSKSRRVAGIRTFLMFFVFFADPSKNEWYQSVDPKLESIKKIFKKTPAAGGENFLIRYLGLGTSRLRYQ